MSFRERERCREKHALTASSFFIRISRGGSFLWGHTKLIFLISQEVESADLVAAKLFSNLGFLWPRNISQAFSWLLPASSQYTHTFTANLGNRCCCLPFPKGRLKVKYLDPNLPLYPGIHLLGSRHGHSNLLMPLKRFSIATLGETHSVVKYPELLSGPDPEFIDETFQHQGVFKNQLLLLFVSLGKQALPTF